MVDLMADSFDVDDFTSGASTIGEGFEIYQKAKSLMKSGGFNLRKWKTNSVSLQNRIDQVEFDPVLNQKPEPDKLVKILGLSWNVNEDEFCYDLQEMITFAKSLLPTKRSVLKVSVKLFDPLGLLSPFVISTKVLFQRLCVHKIEWDQALEGEWLKWWNQFCGGLEALSSVKIPRCYYLAGETMVLNQIHGFSDASEQAYAAVVYVRSVYCSGNISVSLVASKTRVAPLKRQTIPRLELLGANVLARLVNCVASSFLNVEVCCWTDSFTVLCWIRNSKPWRQYVQHRVQEIRRLTGQDTWRFCPGSCNPADIPSRSCLGQELIDSELWWKGPDFLRSAPEFWPDMPACRQSNIADEELIRNPPLITHSLVSAADEHPTCTVSDVIDITRYSSRLKVLRVTAWVLKFVRLFRSEERNINRKLEASDLKEAECMWIRDIQKNCFTNEYRELMSGKKIIYNNQLKLSVNEDHLICCQGRLDNADLPLPWKNPVLLPTKHYYTQLLIKEKHYLVHHNGVRETLAAVREGHWIIRGRETVKKIIRKCVVCQRCEGKPYTTPAAPPLPEERVSDGPPFSNTGVDFAGPLYVKEGTADQQIKVYVCLYTCASTRAVHLELTRELSAVAFLQCFRKFCARRGIPAVIMSDNAKTFKHSSKEVKKIVRSDEVHEHMTNHQIEWQFIAEKAPWWGGYWERMVQSMKRCLRKTIGRSTLTIEEMSTVLVEVEATLNNRPLTYIYDDTEGVSFALTPAHLIYGRKLVMRPSDQQFEVASTAETLTKRAKHQFRVLSNFVRIWKREYLVSLYERSLEAGGGCNNIKIGDIVLLREDGTVRALWKLAKIVEPIMGRDGHIRSARIQLMSKDKVIKLRRPIQHLIPLEVSKLD